MRSTFGRLLRVLYTGEPQREQKARNFPGELDMRHLVFAYRYFIGTVDQNICRLKQRITKEAVGR